MKCITYISKVISAESGTAVPSGFSEIYMGARRLNGHYNITGVLSFKSGHYLQIIEGENNSVDRLYRNIRADKRHQQVLTLLDQTIDKRSFPDSPMRLITATQQDRKLHSFFSGHKHSLSRLSRDKHILLKKFYDMSQISEASSYMGKSIALESWPNFNKIKRTPQVIELSARLTRGFCPYSALLNDSDHGSQDELNDLLDTFSSYGLLKISDSSSDVTSNTQKAPSDRFYNKMKKFLRFG